MAPADRTDFLRLNRPTPLDAPAPRVARLPTSVGNQAVLRAMRATRLTSDVRPIVEARLEVDVGDEPIHIDTAAVDSARETKASGHGVGVCAACHARRLAISGQTDTHEREAEGVVSALPARPSTTWARAASPAPGRRAPRGQALPSGLRSYYESALGGDLRDVRVHTDAGAARAAGRLSARAFTVGHDIAFAGGQYAPSTAAGRALLAHELVHVLQSHSGPVAVHRQVSTTAPVVSREPRSLSDGALATEYQRVLAATDPAFADYLVTLESELILRIQAQLRVIRRRSSRAREGPPIAEAGVSPLTILLALRLALGSGTGGAGTTLATTAHVAATATVGEGAVVAATATTGRAVSQAAVGEVATVAAERGILGELFAGLLSAPFVFFSVLLWSSPIGDGTLQDTPEQEDRRQRSACSRRFPNAIPIRWPPPVWVNYGVGDPGSTSPEFNYPGQPLLFWEGEDLFEITRPENRRYRRRVQQLFGIDPRGYEAHHKWPPSLGGPGTSPATPVNYAAESQLAAGDYSLQGDVLFAPNLVLLTPSIHRAWHAFLARQPGGPGVGTAVGTAYCVLDLMGE